MYDYVIVGAGSAGCVLANRLSEDPGTSVLLIEAGPPDRSSFIHMPATFTALFRSQHDWDYGTGWEPGLNNRRVFLPRGRTLGGSSSINAMIYIRGNRRDWDEWAAEGCTGWDWAAIEPYFRRSEGNARGADAVHGGDGPLLVGDCLDRNVLAEAFLDSAVAVGHPLTDDFNGPEQDGVGWYQTTITPEGRRASAAVCYLHPVTDRPNLTVETHLHVTRILFDGARAAGVEALRLSELHEFRAAREVIVCGGTYNSPQLLTLSGLGRPDELALLQVPPVAELPGVGLNLSDHPTAGATFTTRGEDSLKDALNDQTLAQWMAGAGPLSTNGAQAGGFLRTQPGLAVPDVQLHLVSAIFEQEGLMPPSAHGVSLSACVLRPLSRGQVAVVSPDPTTKPLILHNYFCEEQDMRSAIAGVRAVMEIAGTGALADRVAGPHVAPTGDDDASIEAHIRATMQTIYHPVGTCRMGADALAVVDAECRVHGVEGLRVVDASVFPSVPRGNTNAPTIALAERAADLIRGVAPLGVGAARAGLTA